ncbi:MAG: hypothetical protein AB7N80_16060 [Bdellovibrionales bacterium]
MRKTHRQIGYLFFSLATALISWSAKADCSHFAGSYTCRQVEDDELFTATISFPNQNQIVMADAESQDLLTFDSWVSLTDTQDLRQREAWARCEKEGRLSTAYRGIDVDQHGQRTGALSWNSSWRLHDGRLTVYSEGEMTPDHGQKVYFAGEFHCEPKRK